MGQRGKRYRETEDIYDEGRHQDREEYRTQPSEVLRENNLSQNRRNKRERSESSDQDEQRRKRRETEERNSNDWESQTEQPDERRRLNPPDDFQEIDVRQAWEDQK